MAVDVIDGGPVPPDIVLTQTGHVTNRCSRWHRVNFSFRSSLRADQGETYVSAIAGRLTVDEAVPLVSRGDRAGEADAARYAPTEVLIKAGFQVTFRPTRTIPSHVAIAWVDEWGEDTAVLFGQCFTEYVPGVPA